MISMIIAILELFLFNTFNVINAPVVCSYDTVLVNVDFKPSGKGKDADPYSSVSEPSQTLSQRTLRISKHSFPESLRV